MATNLYACSLFLYLTSMTNVLIDEYCSDDKQALIDLILSIQQKEFEIPIDLDSQPDLLNIPGFYQAGNGNFWVAKTDGIVAGTIALLDIGSQRVALRKMFVKAELRGSAFGIGQRLLDTVFKWTAEKNIQTILLGTTSKFLAAQRFYEKNGFVEIGKSLLPKEFPVMPVDVKFYRYDTGEMRHDKTTQCAGCLKFVGLCCKFYLWFGKTPSVEMNIYDYQHIKNDTACCLKSIDHLST